MPLDPLILMIFGAAIILAAALWYRPRVGIGRGKATGAQGTKPQTDGDDQPCGAEATGRLAVRDWIGWVIGLFGATVAAYGLYLQIAVP